MSRHPLFITEFLFTVYYRDNSRFGTGYDWPAKPTIKINKNIKRSILTNCHAKESHNNKVMQYKVQ